MNRKTVLLALMASAIATLAFPGEPSRWLNLHVQERDDGTEVRLHVPFPLVHAVVGAVHSRDLENGKVSLHIEDCDVDWPAILRELKSAPEGEYLTVKDPSADVQIVKRAGSVAIDVHERGGDHAVVRLRVAEPLLASLSVDERNRLDVAALLAALERQGVGDVLTVTSDEAQVRLWVE